MKIESELLCLVNQSALSEQDQKRKQELIERTDWLKLARLAELNAAIPWTYKQLKLDSKFPSEWNAISETIEHAGRERQHWLIRVLKEAELRNIDVILLKGSMLAVSVYKDSGYKKMNDVDVLVKKQDAAKLLEILKSLQFQSVGGLLSKDEVSEKTHHAPPYVSSDLKCIIGVHWGLTSPQSKWKVDHDSLWERKVLLSELGKNVFRLSWEENLLHLCIHLPFFKTGLRELADVYNICFEGRATHSLDWNLFDSHVKKWKAEDAAYRVLKLAQCLRPIDVDPELLFRWKNLASLRTVRDTEVRASSPQILLNSRSVHIGKIEKAFAIFKLSENYKERVFAWSKTWTLAFCPSENELKKMMLLRDEKIRSKIKARFQAPGACLSALARDHGKFPIFFITVYNIFDLIKSSLLLPFRSQKPPLTQGRSGEILKALE